MSWYTDTFTLERDEDESGISGTGTVAVGVRFPGGKCALRWLTEHSSVAVYDDVQTVRRIHGHGGKTRVVFDMRHSVGDSPFKRGAHDCIQDICEGVDGRGLDGERPEWIDAARYNSAYFAEYMAGYRDAYDGQHGLRWREDE